MMRSALVALLVRGAAALETPGDLNADEVEHVINDLRDASKKFGRGMRLFEPEQAPRTLAQLAQEAIDVQNASNPLGVSKSYGEALLELSKRLRLDKLPCGTDDIAGHAIARLWASKVHSLHGMGMSDTNRFHEANQDCEALAAFPKG